jgi:integrase
VAIWAVLRDGPLRRSEAADLRWEDVTFQASGARGSSPRGPPLEDLLALRPAYLDPQALVFGISDGQVGRRVRAAALHAGTELTDRQMAVALHARPVLQGPKGQRASRGAVARYYGVDG